MLTSWLAGKRLVFRSVALLFLALVLLGIVLDRVLLAIAQDQEVSQERRWLAANFELLAQQLGQTGPPGWPAVLEQFGQRFELKAEVFRDNEIAMPEKILQELAAGEVVQLYQLDGRPQFFQRIDDRLPGAEGLVLSLSSTSAPPPNNSLHWLSYLYYLGAFCLLLWWVRPLVMDIDRLNSAASRLGQDIHAETPELSEVSQLTVLSATFRRMAEQIKSMLQGQKEMTNALSHELRTPLARVKFGLAVLDKQVAAEVREELQNIGRDIDEFDGLVDRMLDYARLEDPAAQYQPEMIDTAAWLAEICGKARAEAQGLVCDYTVDEGAAEMYADPELLGLAFSNLLSNAMRYAQNRIEVHCRRDGEYWYLQVEDDGPGVPPAQQADVFKAFTRLDESRDRGTGGHGLGLAIVARIAALHGGQCSAGVSPLGGAAFTLSVKI